MNEVLILRVGRSRLSSALVLLDCASGYRTTHATVLTNTKGSMIHRRRYVTKLDLIRRLDWECGDGLHLFAGWYAKVEFKDPCLQATVCDLAAISMSRVS